MKQSRKIRRSWLKSIPEWMKCFCLSASKKARRISQWTIEKKRRIKKYVKGACSLVGSACRVQFATVKSGLHAYSKEWTTALLTAGLVVSPLVVDAAPEGGVVVGGQATIIRAGDVTNIAQASQRAAIDWTSFNIAAKETVNFQQPNSQAVALNRVLGNNPTEIYGHLNANGQVYLSNPNGMVFASGAQINVAGLIATTSHVDPLAFMNNGTINTSERNSSISNQGSIFASGMVRIEGATAINNSGLIKAQSISNADGKVILSGAQNITNAGTIDSGINGIIDISARSNIATEIGGASINGELKAGGGRVTIDADLVGIGGNINLTSVTGGTLQLTAATIMQTANAAIQADGEDVGGNISYKAVDGVLLSGAIRANGARGGAVEILGKNINLQAAGISAKGTTDGGQINIGGDWQGSGERRHAANTYVNSATELDVSATAGQGGTVVVWSDKATGYYGVIDAAGQNGQGGAVEVSGLGDLLYAGQVNAGVGGKLLLDPKNITVGVANPFQNTPMVMNQSAVTGGTLSTNFGTSVITTTTGDYLIGDDGCTVGGVTGGAIFLFDKASGALKATLYGSHDGDAVSTASDKILTNNGTATGKYVFAYVTWNGNRGAVSLVDPATITGVNAVSAVNSLVGTQAGDNVGHDVTALSNGNYVVGSRSWKNGTAASAGAATWGNGASGVTGVISPTNSLVGTQKNDLVGKGGIIALSNGNYVVDSNFWANGTAAQAGAVTWGNGTSGVTGVISPTNSLVGTQVYDAVGLSGIAALSNGNYVVGSNNWANGTMVCAGAATWGNGTSGITGVISLTNSLVGTQAEDNVGHDVTALSKGNYVVGSKLWSNGTVAAVGAATWGDGTSGITGVISPTNSLVGTQEDDEVSKSGITALSNGNYVVGSNNWANGTELFAGAATWGNGTSGVTGAVSSTNSLVGTQRGDNVGLWATALSNGNYVVRSYFWANGAESFAGEATWGNGTSGITGVVSSTNSLVGTHASDKVGFDVTALSNGNYVVGSFYWRNGGEAAGIGAATWGNGTSGITGAVSSTNSLVGTQKEDWVGVEVKALSNGNYVVRSYNWANGTVAQAGAATWGNGTSGVTGVISSTNSLVGTQASDFVGIVVTALNNGNYVVGSRSWNNGTVAQAGAATWGNGESGVTGVISPINSLVGTQAGQKLGGHIYDDAINNRILAGDDFNSAVYAYSNVVSAAALLNQLDAYATQPTASLTTLASTITNALNQGTDVTFKANNDIMINQNVISTNTTAGVFRLYAGRSININADITVSAFSAVANETVADGVIAADRDPGAGNIIMASGTTLRVTSGATLGILNGFTGGSIALANITANTINANAVGNLTILSDATITTGATGNALMLATSGNFINSGGAAALSATNGRWLVCSANPAADTRGGLTYAFKQYNSTYGSLVLGTGNGYLYSLAPTISYTIAGTASKVYDGTTVAPISGIASHGITGFIDGDSGTVTITGANYDNKNIGVGKTVSISTANIAATNGVATVYGYSSAPGVTGAIGEITPNPVPTPEERAADQARQAAINAANNANNNANNTTNQKQIANRQTAPVGNSGNTGTSNTAVATVSNQLVGGLVTTTSNTPPGGVASVITMPESVSYVDHLVSGNELANNGNNTAAVADYGKVTVETPE
ncbi:MAG: filamentous hemagglutinin N-terminal domain-containing protein [Negativicutes bacterium]